MPPGDSSAQRVEKGGSTVALAKSVIGVPPDSYRRTFRS